MPSRAQEQHFQADPAQAGQRLDVALAHWLDEPRSQAAARISRGEVRVDGRPVAKSLRLTGRESVTVQPPPPRPSGAAGVAPPPVRWQDEHLLVVAKPPGLVVHPGVAHEAGTLVQALAEAGYPLAPAGGVERPGIVHRLDRDTSGLMVVAKTDEAHTGLVGLLRRREVERRYLTLVERVPPAALGRVEAPIGRDLRNRLRFAVVAGGKPAVTRWRLRAEGRVGEDRVALLDCRLETGRTHQVRVHLAYAGHPVAGDLTYGASSRVAGQLGLTRPFLHAGRIAFTHPVTQERVVVEEPLPTDLVDAAAVAGVAEAVRQAWDDVGLEALRRPPDDQ